MRRIQVRLDFAHTQHRFSLRTEKEDPAFIDLCKTIVKTLKLPLSPARLADVDRSPLRLTYFHEDTPHLLASDEALRKALRYDPTRLNLRMMYVDKMHEDRSETRKPSSKTRSHRSGSRSRTKSPSRSARSRSASRASARASSTRSFSRDVLASATSLLDILNHLRRRGTRQVKAAIEDLQESIIVNSCDAAKLDEARDNLARVFSVFLNRVSKVRASKVPEDLVEATLDAFENVGEQFSISSATIESASTLLRVIAENESDVHCVQEKWADIAAHRGQQNPDDGNESSSSSETKSSKKSKKDKKDRKKKKKKRRHRRQNVFYSADVDPYVGELDTILRAGGEGVVERYRRLVKTAQKNRSLVRAGASINARFCRSIEKCFYHAVRRHGMSEEHQVNERGRRALCRSVKRRLERAGFDEKFIRRAVKLTAELVLDPAVVELIHIFAINGGPEMDDEEVLAMEEEFEREPIDELDGEFDVGDFSPESDEDEEGYWNRRRKKRKSRRRKADEEEEHERARSRSHSRSRSRHRSRSHSRSHRSRSRSRSHSRRSGSRRSNDRFGFGAAEERWGDVSEHEDDYESNDTSSLSDRTVDTSKSEWARIEMEKEALANRHNHAISSGRRTRHSPPSLRRRH